MVIGLTGLINAGKSTVAQHLMLQYGFVLVKFAQGLKDMMRALGLNESEIEGVLKELPCDKLNGRTPRYAMQTLGTEWGRNHMGQDFWVNLLVQKVHQMDCNVVIDDCRFPNEAVAVQRDLQGKVWRLVRAASYGTHSSERDQAYITPDLTLMNTGTLDELLEKVDTVLSDEHH